MYFLKEFYVEDPKHLMGCSMLPLEGENGFLVSQEQLDKFLKQHNLLVQSSNPCVNLSGVSLLVLDTSKKAKKRGHPKKTKEVQGDQDVSIEVIIKDCWEGPEDRTIKDEFALAAFTHLGFMGKNIQIYNPKTPKTEPVFESESFNIFISTSPCDTTVTKTPKTFFGVTVDHTKDGLYKYGEFGSPVGDGTNVAAELLVNNLYILYDINTKGSKKEIQIFNEILAKAAIIIKEGEIQEPNYRKFFVRSRLVDFDTIKTKATKRFKDLQASALSYKKEYLDKLSSLAEAKALNDSLSKETHEKNAGREFDSLLKQKGITDIRAVPGLISIVTDNIFVKNEGVTYDIGVMQIDLYTAEDFKIRFKNLTRKGTGGGYNQIHPHVSSSGSACWGNIELTIIELFRSMNYAALVSLILSYLQTVNTGDPAGSGIYNSWPTVQKKEITKGASK